MVQNIKQHPIPEGFEFGGAVRHFDETLFTLIQDLKDTIEANDLHGLAAFQISSPFAVIVIKQEDNTFLEIINPVIIKREGSITPIEATAYFPGLSATTKRYEKIKLMYEDREGKQQFLSAEGDMAILIQRKTDYLLGANFRIRMSQEEKQLFENKLELNTDDINATNCPATLPHEKILLIIKYGLILGILGLVVSFFVSSETVDMIKVFEKYLLFFLLFLVGFYIFYAQYEGKKYKSCTSCQISNIMGIAVIKTIHVLLLAAAAYFIL